MNSTLCRLFICFLFFFSAIGMFSFTIPSKQQAISLGFQFPVCSIPFCYDQLTSLLCLLLIPYNVSIWFSVEDGLLVPGTLRLALKAQTEEKNGLDSSVQFCASGYACPSSPFIPGARRRSPENQQVLAVQCRLTQHFFPQSATTDCQTEQVTAPGLGWVVRASSLSPSSPVAVPSGCPVAQHAALG